MGKSLNNPLSCAVIAGGLALAVIVPLAAAAAPAAREVASPHTSLRYDRDYPTIDYGGVARNNPIARLQARIDRGEVRLDFRPGRGYLDSLLGQLDIDPSSQVLVYSKTSLQIEHISGATPRAIYFNDDTYVAWVQDSDLLELSVMDADLGAVFYTLRNRADEAPQVQRETSRCLACHDTFSMTGGGVPRFLLDSIVVDTSGTALRNEVPREITDETPLQQRWGGWYVTGLPDGLPHLGNLQIPHSHAVAEVHGQHGATVESLAGLFDTRPYVTGTSDVVALLVLEHQLFVKNLVTRLNFKTRSLLAREASERGLAQIKFEQSSPQTQEAVHRMTEDLVRAMLFMDAAVYPRPVGGTSGYDKWFQAQGPRDQRGRSLRDLDLHSRLFKYPLSYVIYSEAFNALPADVKQLVYARLREILRGPDGPAPPHLSASDRAAILEILIATKPDFAATQVAQATEVVGR
jgi:hypothetical protein